MASSQVNVVDMPHVASDEGSLYVYNGLYPVAGPFRTEAEGLAWIDKSRLTPAKATARQ